MRETWVLSWSQEDPLENGMATHFRILLWRIPCTEEPGGLQSIGLQRVRDSEQLTEKLTLSLFSSLYAEELDNQRSFAALCSQMTITLSPL